MPISLKIQRHSFCVVLFLRAIGHIDRYGREGVKIAHYNKFLRVSYVMHDFSKSLYSQIVVDSLNFLSTPQFLL
jgi:hypothetical protein